MRWRARRNALGTPLGPRELQDRSRGRGGRGILPEKLLVKCPPITITDRAALEASPKGIRPDGYGYSVGERVVRSGPMGRNAPILADIMRV